MVVGSIYAAYGIEYIITSCNDSKHGDGTLQSSLHYLGRAFDVRTKNVKVYVNSVFNAQLTESRKQDILKLCQDNLGPEFDVLLESKGTENEHLHVEWDPKTSKVNT